MNEQPKPSDSSTAVTNPLNTFLGAGISSGFAFALYLLTSSIITSFASKPVTSDNPTVISLTAAVRTLVMGVAVMGTGVFTIIALGLLLITIQMTFQKFKAPSSSD